MNSDASYLGNYCCLMTVNDVRGIGATEWADAMEENYGLVTPHALGDSQRRAWRDELKVLKRAFKDLPECYDGLDVIFEYVIPGNTELGEEPDPEIVIRPDVIILSSKKVLVLEFKQRDEDLRCLQKAARKYVKSIKRYHVNRPNRSVRGVLVLTHAEEYQAHEYRLESCSPDTLATVIRDFFEDACEPIDDVFTWLETKFALI